MGLMYAEVSEFVFRKIPNLRASIFNAPRPRRIDAGRRTLVRPPGDGVHEDCRRGLRTG